MSNEITVTARKATNIEAGETYGYMAASRSFASTITITSVTNDRAQAICTHWDESWIATFDAKTGEGTGDWEGAQLLALI